MGRSGASPASGISSASGASGASFGASDSVETSVRSMRREGGRKRQEGEPLQKYRCPRDPAQTERFQSRRRRPPWTTSGGRG
ncbi:MAG: hypothetical protein BRD47_05740 [Bacteroidetes bacterium QS_8_68_28]|nr:MAG: hypothetical protein BRD47_05740 [Bacteroidetes bacterium QS_8_68_28]